MLKHFVGRKNARVFLGSYFSKNQLIFNSLRTITQTIFPPQDRLKPEPITLEIGDHASSEREFTREDLKLFSTAAQDKHAAHLNPDNIKTFYKSNIVYGIFSSSMFTMIVRDLFPGAIYLDQTLKFKAPIHVDEKVTARITVKEIREDKKIVTFVTIVTKNSEDNKLAIEGEGKFIIPNLKPRDRSPSKKKEEEEKKTDSEPTINGKSFDEFVGITDKTKEDLVARGITGLFPIQAETFNEIYNHSDVIARDLTGTGKTLAYCLPIVERFRKDGILGRNKNDGKRNTLCLILTPTRELALQVSKELETLKHYPSEFKVLTVYGGVSYENQEQELRKGVEFIVGTTGRVLDHIERKNTDFSNIQTVVLDEADRMLDMGFQEDVDSIMNSIKDQSTKKSQFILFSATIPPWVKNVARKSLSEDYKTIDLVKDLKNKTAKCVEHLTVQCSEENKIEALADILNFYGNMNKKTIVFAQTKLQANEIIVSEKLNKKAEVLHGDINQQQREVTLQRFRDGKFNVLVATDVAARGLDIPNVDLIVQLQPPFEIESYIHRSGRTARAGNDGKCITFYSNYEHQKIIKQIEEKAGIKLKKIGLPNREDIVKSSAKELTESLDEVDDKVLDLFKETATKLILDRGALHAVSIALAHLSGATKKIEKRSLITGDKGMVTLQFNSKIGEVELFDILNILSRITPNFKDKPIKNINFHKNGEGCVFDIPQDIYEKLQENYEADIKSGEKETYTLQVPTELPELKENERRRSYNSAKSGYAQGSYKRRSNDYSRNDRSRDRSRDYSQDNDSFDEESSHKRRSNGYKSSRRNFKSYEVE